MDDIADAIERFWAYKPEQDESPIVPASKLFEAFQIREDSKERASISTFAGMVNCPYRIVNIGMGHKPRFGRDAVARMSKGLEAHKRAEKAVRAAAAESTAKDGPPDLASAPADLVRLRDQDLLEAPELPVSLSVNSLHLSGRADGLLRKNGVVIAVERKPRSRMYHPATTLQVMTYAIGGCLSLRSDRASNGAQWTVSDYHGKASRNGHITESVCDLLGNLGRTYLGLLDLGRHGAEAPILRGPGNAKCAKCEYHSKCRFKYQPSADGRGSTGEPVWLQYTKRKSGRGSR